MTFGSISITSILLLFGIDVPVHLCTEKIKNIPQSTFKNINVPFSPFRQRFDGIRNPQRMLRRENIFLGNHVRENKFIDDVSRKFLTLSLHVVKIFVFYETMF